MKNVCDLCNSENFDIIYSGKIRDGSYGKYTNTDRNIIKCANCGLIRLEKNELPEDFYQSSNYRNSYNDTDKSEDYIQAHDIEQIPKLQHLNLEDFRDKVVLDNGCGGGAFLDLIHGVSSKSIGIEPFTSYHKSLTKRNHEIFSDAKSALETYKGKIDTIISTGVIEHVDSPTMYLEDSLNLLSDKGSIYLETDNFDDILRKLNIKNFESFFYRTAHLTYFSSDTLVKLFEKVGFSQVQVLFRHNFDFSNFAVWSSENVPSGNGKLNYFDNKFNTTWKSYLEESGLADLVCIKARKI